MGSPIDSWEGVGPYFTGAGGFTPGLFLFLAIVAVIGAIAYGAMQEEAAHKEKKD
ncbi:MAG: hypothetical protein AAF675_11450 [Pseudomonadota bacterium]